jgi:outer membrane protein assembly factor BamB
MPGREKKEKRRMSDKLQDPASQAGTTSSLPDHTPMQPHRRRLAVPFIVLIVFLLAGGLFAGFALIRPHNATSPGFAQGKGPIYYVTPQGGPPSSTPQANPGGPMILSAPTPAFFLDGRLYRNSSAYSADSGALMQHYLQNLGNVTIYHPQMANGVLYMAVRQANFQESMGLYAVRASDGVVLWQWSDCGESVNMSAPVILNQTVYLICQVAPLEYKLCAFQARTGTPLWSDSLSGDVGFDLLASQQVLYIYKDNQLLTMSATTGRQIWQKSLGTSDNTINQILLNQDMLYVVQQKTFTVLRASDGKLLWQYNFIGDYGYLSAVNDQQTVYLFASQVSGPTTLYALNGVTGSLRWQKSLGNNDNASSIVDQGNLYLLMNVFSTPQPAYPEQFSRKLLALRGSDGSTLWQQEIPWNKGKLNYAMIEEPALTAGAGRLYVVDWQRSLSSPTNLPLVLGAFSEDNGAVLWTKILSQTW